LRLNASGFSGGKSEFLVIGGIGIGEGTADLTEDVGGRDGVCPGIGVLQQQRQGLTGMRMGDRPTQGSPLRTWRGTMCMAALGGYELMRDTLWMAFSGPGHLCIVRGLAAPAA
jgi:hypothetical protein